ncbi:AmmeMemoRadiSam system protein B [Patescibacteria group bacterium]|nr:AmmeMemoRadiSam system protein B [Patescibacteria group bacterium]MBU1705843.1 AmmeMemoRadiSam system protein B [Patescibacteria group bacterium]
MPISRLTILFLLFATLLISGAFYLGRLFSTQPAPAVRALVDQVIAVATQDTIDPDRAVFSSGADDQAFFDRAYAKAGQVKSVSAQSAISAHHLLVADKIAALFSSIGNDSAKQVIILSPNHFSMGLSPAQISDGVWETPYGILETEESAVRELNRTLPLIRIEEIAFEREHGIGALTPFIKKSFPTAKLIPLVLAESLTDEQINSIADTIADQFPNALIIGSMDMSHYLPASASEFHDATTLSALTAGQADLDLEIDSNAVMQILLAVNRQRGDGVWHQTHHGNSLTMMGGLKNEDNTSHIIGYFTQGDSQTDSLVSLHFVGDIMLDRGVRQWMGDDYQYPWKNMERFLSGADLVIGNLEGSVTDQPSIARSIEPPFQFRFAPEAVSALAQYVDLVSLGNNHAFDFGTAGLNQTHQYLNEIGLPYFGDPHDPAQVWKQNINGQNICLIGFNSFTTSQSAILDTVRAHADNCFVIALPHWGEEYQTAATSGQRALAQKLIEAGADAIIGTHPHVAQNIEIINNRIVIYSLGNFIFDQNLPATWPALTAGLTISPEAVKIYLIPINTKNGQPIPLNRLESRTLLNQIANSSSDLTQQIQQGLITIPYEHPTQEARLQF